jgi:RNA polymerase sigma factor (sigma-70 family)
VPVSVDDGEEPQDSAYRRVYEENLVAVSRYVYARVDSRASAEAVIQDVFVVAWRRPDAVPSGREGTMWLLGVARRLIASHHRGETRRRRLLGRLGHQRPVAAAGEGRSDPELDEAIASLREADKELLRLVFWDGLSREEAAGVLGCSVNAVYVRMHRLRQRLAQRLGQPPPVSLGASPRARQARS